MGAKAAFAFEERAIDMARVLLVDDDPASRLTLHKLLTMSGYSVDSATSSSEAIRLLENCEYSLVLGDLHSESKDAELQLMAFARSMLYRPATAVVTSSVEYSPTARNLNDVVIEPEDVPELLEKVADLIGERASRMLARELRQSRN